MSSDNYKILFRMHIVLGLLVLFLFGFVLLFASGDLTPSGRIYLPIITTVIPLLHLIIAWACKVQSEVGRLASRIVGFIMLIFLPIGTILGLIILQNSKNKSHENQAS